MTLQKIDKMFRRKRVELLQAAAWTAEHKPEAWDQKALTQNLEKLRRREELVAEMVQLLNWKDEDVERLVAL